VLAHMTTGCEGRAVLCSLPQCRGVVWQGSWFGAASGKRNMASFRRGGIMRDRCCAVNRFTVSYRQFCDMGRGWSSRLETMALQPQPFARELVRPGAVVVAGMMCFGVCGIVEALA